MPPAPTTSTLVTTTTTTTAEPDSSSVALDRVPGNTTTTVHLGPGTAKLTGTVVGPDGPVGGAVVHAERLVGDEAAVVDVLTAPDGTWELPGIKGGRYRLRAWRAPDLVLLGEEVLFVGATDTRVVSLVVERHGGVAVEAAVAPHPPPVGGAANLAVRVLQRTVDGRGVLMTKPVAGISVELVPRGSWTILSANPTTTDAGGTAPWQLRCGVAGTQGLDLALGATVTRVSVAACQ